MADIQEHFIPVHSRPCRNSWSFLIDFLLGRTDAINMWPPGAYSIATKRLRLINQTYVLCNHPDAVRHVMLDNHENYDLKSPMQRQWLEPLLGDGLFVSDGPLWQERRSACAPAVANVLLAGQAALMSRAAFDLALSWQALAPGQPVDMLQEMSVLTSQIIGKALFGDTVSTEEAHQVVEAFTAFQSIGERVDLALVTGVKALGWFGRRGPKDDMVNAAKRVHEIIDRMLLRYQSAGSQDRTTLPGILSTGRKRSEGLPVCPMSAEAIRNESIVMFMAGHETTANTLAWTWYLLDGADAVRDRLHAELDSVLAGRTPTLDDVPKLVYTRAVIEEALRLYPPVAVMARQARHKDTVCGEKVEPGTIMLIIPWLLHRHRRFWEDPNAFRPDRFLPLTPRPSKYLYIPFSVGPRVCMGLRFGLTESILCLATLAQRFAPRVIDRSKVEISYQLTLRPKNGLKMLIEAR